MAYIFFLFLSLFSLSSSFSLALLKMKEKTAPYTDSISQSDKDELVYCFPDYRVSTEIIPLSFFYPLSQSLSLEFYKVIFFLHFLGIFMTYTEAQKKNISNTSFIYLPLAVGDEIFQKSWADLIKSKIDTFNERKELLDSLTQNSFKLPIGKIQINEKSFLDITLESYSLFEENWNNDTNCPPDIPIKIVIKYSIPTTFDYNIPPSFSRKKDRNHQNLELHSLLNYTLTKLPVTEFLQFIESNGYTNFKKEIANV